MHRPPLLRPAFPRSFAIWPRPCSELATRTTTVPAMEACRNSTPAQHHRLNVPRSTAAMWTSRGPRPLVTRNAFDQDRQPLLDTAEKPKRRA